MQAKEACPCVSGFDWGTEPAVGSLVVYRDGGSHTYAIVAARWRNSLLARRLDHDLYEEVETDEIVRVVNDPRQIANELLVHTLIQIAKEEGRWP